MTDKTKKPSLFRVLSRLILFPLILLVSWPISVIGTRSGRFRGGVLQTPTRIYQHSGSGRTVFVVGVIHIGKKAYYQSLQSLIDQLSSHGFQVLYEGVGKMDDKDERALPAKQRHIVTQLKNISLTMEGMTTFLADEDVVFQKQGLTYPDTWIRTDVEISYIAQLFAEANMNVFEVSTEQPIPKPPGDIPENIAAFIKGLLTLTIRLLPGIKTLSKVLEVFNRQQRVRNNIIISIRDTVAARGILEHTQHTDVVSIWGSGHIPGIHRHLSAAGYQHTKTIWFDAF